MENISNNKQHQEPDNDSIEVQQIECSDLCSDPLCEIDTDNINLEQEIDKQSNMSGLSNLITNSNITESIHNSEIPLFKKNNMQQNSNIDKSNGGQSQMRSSNLTNSSFLNKRDYKFPQKQSKDGRLRRTQIINQNQKNAKGQKGKLYVSQCQKKSGFKSEQLGDFQIQKYQSKNLKIIQQSEKQHLQSQYSSIIQNKSDLCDQINYEEPQMKKQTKSCKQNKNQNGIKQFDGLVNNLLKFEKAGLRFRPIDQSWIDFWKYLKNIELHSTKYLLSLQFKNFDGKIIFSSIDTPLIQFLILVNCNIKDQDWKILIENASLFPNLKVLYLMSNSIINIRKNDLRKFPCLQYANLQSNDLSNQSIKNLKELQNQLNQQVANQKSSQKNPLFIIFDKDQQ